MYFHSQLVKPSGECIDGAQCGVFSLAVRLGVWKLHIVGGGVELRERMS